MSRTTEGYHQRERNLTEIRLQVYAVPQLHANDVADRKRRHEDLGDLSVAKLLADVARARVRLEGEPHASSAAEWLIERISRIERELAYRHRRAAGRK